MDRGEALYEQYCQGCHGSDGQGRAKLFMPHVNTLAKPDYMGLVTDEFLELVIRRGGEAVGKNAYMPAWGSLLDDREISDLVAYIRTFTEG